MIADLIRGVPSPLYFQKRLPAEFGRLRVLVSPKADMRVLYPGFDRSAHDLILVARNFVSKGDVVWDVGSNQGIFSVLAAHKAGPEGRVFAVEADPASAHQQNRTFQALPKTVAPCSVLATAVADQVSILDFAVSAKGSTRSGLADAVDTEIASVKPVVSVTLDFLLDHWPAPKVMKLDVEGADLIAFRGADRLLGEIKPVIYFEPTEATFEETQDLLHSYGYVLHRLAGDGTLEPLEAFSMYVMAMPS